MSIAIVEKKKNPASWKPGGIRSPGIRLPEPKASRRLNTSGKDGGTRGVRTLGRWPEGAALCCPFGKERTAADTRKGASGCIPGPYTGNLHRQACPLDATWITVPCS